VRIFSKSLLSRVGSFLNSSLIATMKNGRATGTALA